MPVLCESGQQCITCLPDILDTTFCTGDQVYTVFRSGSAFALSGLG